VHNIQKIEKPFSIISIYPYFFSMGWIVLGLTDLQQNLSSTEKPQVIGEEEPLKSGDLKNMLKVT